MNIQAIIFDVGGVLIRTADRSSRQNLEARLGLAEWESEKIVFNSEMGRLAQKGHVTTDDLWKSVAETLSLTPDEVTRFQQEFWGGDVLDKEMVALIRKLKRRYQTAIISNATDSLREALQTVHPIADAFNLIVVSAEEKIMKPDPEIYRRTLKRLGRQAAETVFIDDFAENIAAAQELGMNTIHFNPSVNLTAELKNLGVNPE
ncbi:MAG: HAD family phosphatase [Candidatus Promineifilaceae bacterium]